MQTIKWEYKILTANWLSSGLMELSNLGSAGWELVSMFKDANLCSWFYLKRPKEST